jgi:hypothetical protein
LRGSIERVPRRRRLKISPFKRGLNITPISRRRIGRFVELVTDFTRPGSSGTRLKGTD